MTPRIFRSDDNLETVEIFLRFTVETLLTAVIFALFEAVTMTLESLAKFEQDRLHRTILDIVEYSIFGASALVILLVIIYLTVMTTLRLYFNFRKNLREKNQASGRMLQGEAQRAAPTQNREDSAIEGDVQPGLSRPRDEAPVEGVPAEEGSPAEELGSLRLNNRFLQAALFVTILSILVVFMVQQTEINSYKHKADASEQELRSGAIRNFVTLCREGKGTFDVRSLICQYQDGRVVPVRLVRAVAPKRD